MTSRPVERSRWPPGIRGRSRWSGLGAAPPPDRQPGDAGTGRARGACSWCRWMRCAAGGATATCLPTCCAPVCRRNSLAGCRNYTGPPPGRTSTVWPMTRCGRRGGHRERRGRQRTGMARELADLTLDEARAAIAGLRPPVLDDLGLADGLTSLARSIGQLDIWVDAAECRFPSTRRSRCTAPPGDAAERCQARTGRPGPG